MKGLPSHPNFALHRWRFADGVPGPTLWYRYWRLFLQVSFAGLWRVRVFNRQYEPAAGSALYLCNHQSFLDPILMSMALKRPMNYMARDTLFHIPGFKQLIASVNAFPVKRNTADTGAIKEALRRLKAGGQLVVFPEGTRTRDGAIGPMLPGVAMLAQRAADWIVPVVVDGAFECWPRTQPLPMPGFVAVAYGPPIPREKVRKMDADEFVAAMRRQLIEIQADLRRRLGRPMIRYEDKNT